MLQDSSHKRQRARHPSTSRRLQRGGRREKQAGVGSHHLGSAGAAARVHQNVVVGPASGGAGLVVVPPLWCRIPPLVHSIGSCRAGRASCCQGQQAALVPAAGGALRRVRTGHGSDIERPLLTVATTEAWLMRLGDLWRSLDRAQVSLRCGGGRGGTNTNCCCAGEVLPLRPACLRVYQSWASSAGDNSIFPKAKIVVAATCPKLLLKLWQCSCSELSRQEGHNKARCASCNGPPPARPACFGGGFGEQAAPALLWRAWAGHVPRVLTCWGSMTCGAALRAPPARSAVSHGVWLTSE